ncbi:MAG: T9SS type A sorting domain-containing protein [Chitinophagales bacterium]|nr:T9SS type A sorting domain-containing protein [Chitinophagales bacterium]
MKSNFLFTILVILMTNVLFAQDWDWSNVKIVKPEFIRIIKPDSADHFEIRTSAFTKDSLLILGKPSKQNNVWPYNVLGMDTLGNWDILPGFNDDQNTFEPESDIILFKYDEAHDELYGVMKQKDDFMLFKSDVNGKHQWIEKLVGLPTSGVNQISKIVRVKDGFLISGQGSDTRNFIIKTDDSGTQLLWTISGNDIYTDISLDSDTTLVSYGKDNNKPGVYYVTFNTYTGKRIKTYHDETVLYVYNVFKDPNSDGYVAVGDAFNENQTNFFPIVVWYDSEFKVKNRTWFGIRPYYEPPRPYRTDSPYKSTMDSEGNIYAVILQYLERVVLWEQWSSEVLEVTKINSNGKMEWISVDSIMLNPIGNAVADNCVSIDLSPTGSVYVSGYFNNPDIPQRQGWVVKYPKRENKNTTTSSEQTVFDDQILSLYPNPTSDKLVIRTHGLIDDALVIITDNTGKIVLKNRIISDAVEVDVRHFISGIYFASLSQNGQVIHTQKFIKQ